jgi:hypothetical protein
LARASRGVHDQVVMSPAGVDEAVTAPPRRPLRFEEDHA